METLINRFAVLLVARKPFYSWQRDLGIGPVDEEAYYKVFLVDWDDSHTRSKDVEVVRAHYERMFAETLRDYSRENWPKMTFEEFQSWFEAKVLTFVSDLGEKPIGLDEG